MDEEEQVRCANSDVFIHPTHSITHPPSSIAPAHLQPLQVVSRDMAIFVTEQPAHPIKVTTTPTCIRFTQTTLFQAVFLISCLVFLVLISIAVKVVSAAKQLQLQHQRGAEGDTSGVGAGKRMEINLLI